MDTLTNQEKSHIQMPNFMLKHFEEKGKYCYYDIKGDYIGTNGHAKSTNTEKGYYSSAMEDDLNIYIETPFSNFLSFVDNALKSKSHFFIPDKHIVAVQNFIYSLWARSPVILKPMTDHATHLQFAANYDDKQIMHDQAVLFGIKAAQEIIDLDDYILTFVENRTDMPFVLPVKGLCSFHVNEKQILMLPVNPRMAILIVHNDLQDIIIKDDYKQIFFEDRKRQILFYNQMLFNEQCKDNWGRVVSADKALLERLKVEYHILMDEYNKEKPKGAE